MIIGTLTGAIRFRWTLFGKAVLQVEYVFLGMAAGSRRIGSHIDWRDATDDDLRDPALRRLANVPRGRAAIINRRRKGALDAP